MECDRSALAGITKKLRSPSDDEKDKIGSVSSHDDDSNWYSTIKNEEVLDSVTFGNQSKDPKGQCSHQYHHNWKLNLYWKRIAINCDRGVKYMCMLIVVSSIAIKELEYWQ